MKTHTSPTTQKQGFALIATISVMVLLVMIALAMLSLSTVSLRSTSSENAQAQARANARMALMLALAELQKYAGDDRRITADGSLVDENAVSSHAVGVWESWSPGLSKDTQGSIPDYEDLKEERFIRWLVAGNESSITELDWVNSAPTGPQVRLFADGTSSDSDGFDLSGALIPTQNGKLEGGFSWAITQENTKAKISVAGPELADREANDDFEVQPRPNVGITEGLTQPEDSWDERSAKIIDLRQAQLDSGLVTGGTTLGADFTATSFGLLTNPVDGGLKVDMSLGFGMEDNDFESDTWDDGTVNPFRSDAVTEYNVPSTYDDQRPLYQPIVDEGTFSHERPWDNRNDEVHSYYPVTAVPTFDTLRSFYRIPYHLYETNNNVTVFERQGDHIAGAEGSISGTFQRPPHIHANGQLTQMGLRPILDRAAFMFSLVLHTDDSVRLAVTPIVTLWNPYNIALEIEGAVAYPWLDLPLRRTYTLPNTDPDGDDVRVGGFLSNDMKETGEARQINGYIFAAITANGGPITGQATPITFEPGEVRTFVPASPTLRDVKTEGSSVRARTVFMRPVDSVGDFVTTGGLSLEPSIRNFSTRLKMDAAVVNEVEIEIDLLMDPDHTICVGLSDATIARGSGPANGTRGQVITDTLSTAFAVNAAANGSDTNVKYSTTFDSLDSGNAEPVFAIEVFHRVADQNQSEADLVYTGNPRQSSMNSAVTKTGFLTGPQYEVRLRKITSVDDLVQIESQGVNRPAAFYGANQSASGGRTHLSFFEIPTEPLISLASLQHADLAPTPFAPANQFANSWASAYVDRDEIIDGNDGLEVDHSYLVNEALWDGFFFSSAAPELEPGSATGSSTIWDNTVANEVTSLEDVLKEFADNPSTSPLRNPRMSFVPSSLDGMTPEEFATAMIEPEASTKIAGHLMVDGAFNVNSTSVAAWTAMLRGLNGAKFDLSKTDTPSTADDADAQDNTPFPRFRLPLGDENDNWQGYRSLTDTEIENLAEEIVDQVRERGPFLSLGEFINRRVEDGDLGLSGALQTAIDATSINQDALQDSLDTSKYDGSEANNISPQDTGVGIPGYLTQADLLKPIAPIITVRSDTFIIRSYGEVRDSDDNITASAWIQATVQRFPDFVDDSDDSSTQISDLNEENQTFGRRFRVVSFCYLSAAEARVLSEGSSI